MTQTSTSEKNEPLPPTEGTEMLDRFWSEIRAEMDTINIVGVMVSAGEQTRESVCSFRWTFMPVNCRWQGSKRL